jgi:hypothetical protein
VCGIILAIGLAAQAAIHPKVYQPGLERAELGRRWQGALDTLVKTRQVQILALVVLGLVLVRGSYLAACSARTTTLLKMTHGLFAGVSLAGVLVLSGYLFFPNVLSEWGTQLVLVKQWGVVALGLGCLLGSVLGCEPGEKPSHEGVFNLGCLLVVGLLIAGAIWVGVNWERLSQLVPALFAPFPAGDVGLVPFCEKRV